MQLGVEAFLASTPNYSVQSMNQSMKYCPSQRKLLLVVCLTGL
jgi:hypothetical protein